MTSIEKQAEIRLARAEMIRAAMEKKAWTKEKLAQESGYEERTIRKVLKGVAVRSQTIIDVCEALEIEAGVPARDDDEIEVAEPWYGSYARTPYKHYEGAYFAYRRSFTLPRTFVRSVYEIKWDDEDWIFTFQEHQSFISSHKRSHKVDHSQSGEVYISQFTDLVHLVTVNLGAVRTITLTKMRGAEPTMRGSVLTQSDRGLFYQPSVSAIYLERIEQFDARHLSMVGLVTTESDDHARIADEIERIEREVIFVASSDSIGKS